MATRLRLPLRSDTVLRLLHSTLASTPPTPRVLGIDACALRKGRVYGTILVDLERRRPVDFLAQRTAETVATWLRAHPGVAILTRDRTQDYARGATDGAPQARQVVNRFHLLCNLHEVLTRSLQRIPPALRRLLASASVAAPPGLARAGLEAPTSAGHGREAGLTPSTTRPPPPALRPLPRYGRSPRLQQEQSARHAARTQRYAQVKTRLAQGQSLRQIAAACGLKTKTVRSWVRTETLPCDQRGYRAAGKIDPSRPSLQTRLAEGCTHQSRLWRAIQPQGFPGTRSLVAQWIPAPGQYTPLALPPAAPQPPAARQRAWLLFQDTEKRSAEAQALVAQLQQHTELTHNRQDKGYGL